MKTVKRYSEAFKKQVVAEYEQGKSIYWLEKKYGIGGKRTIRTWIKKYAPEGLRHELIKIQTADEVDQIRGLEKQVKELQRSLGQMTLEKMKLEALLEELEVDVEAQVKKNEAP